MGETVRGRSDGTVRIISGTWRSRRIATPAGDATRPMLDRVKEAVFDALGSYFQVPGRLPPVIVGDVFAGGGGLGLEALSRGARGTVFVETGERALTTLRRNLATLDVGARGSVEALDAWSVELADVLMQYGCSLVFLDPPYRQARDAGSGGRVMRLLEDLAPLGLRATTALLVLHHPAEVQYDLDGLAGWIPHSRRRYGTTAIAFLAGRGPGGSPAGSEEDRA